MEIIKINIFQLDRIVDNVKKNTEIGNKHNIYNRKYLLFNLIFVFNSCNNSSQNHKVSENKKSVITHNYCSPNPLWYDYIFGNMFVKITPENNFIKCTSINDSTLVISCGRSKNEIELFQKNCTPPNENLNFDGLSLPELFYENANFMILYLKGGSDNWENYFIDFSKNVIYQEKSYYIDTNYLRYVYLDYSKKDNNPLFIIHDIFMNKRDTVATNYNKYREDGFPDLNIFNVFLRQDSLFYSIDTKKGSVQDTIILE